MARPLRILYPGAVYHVMNRGLARQPIFRSAADREAFLATVAEAHAVWGIEVAASCRMDTHYHRVLRTPEPTLPRLLRPPVAAVIQVVAGASAVPPAALLAGRRGRRQEGRQVARWLVKTHGDLTQAETARQFGLGSPGSARWVCGVIRQRLHADRHLRRRLAELEGALMPRTIQPKT